MMFLLALSEVLVRHIAIPPPHIPCSALSCRRMTLGANNSPRVHPAWVAGAVVSGTAFAGPAPFVTFWKRSATSPKV